MNSLQPRQAKPHIVAIPYQNEINGISEVISDELSVLGYQPLYFNVGSLIPEETEVVFSYGPYVKFLTIPRQLAKIPVQKKPVFVHWNTEGIPDLRIPWKLMSSVSEWCSWLGRAQDDDSSLAGIAVSHGLYSLLEHRTARFRYLGDYYYALRQGWLDVFADSSEIYAGIHRQHGLPTIVAPWGGTPRWFKDLGLERDIDVLWMGTRGTRRRSLILDRVRGKLESHGVKMHFADGEENPFIFGDERIHYLNRAKITLNITRTWYDDNFSRFALATPNRSLIVSEPVLPHCSSFVAGTHYVSAPIEKLAETILIYLNHEEERLRIVENAYHLVTSKILFRESIKLIMDAVDKVYQSSHPVDRNSILNIYNLE